MNDLFSERLSDSPLPRSFGEKIGVAQVALGGIAHDEHNELACVLRPLADLGGGMGDCARGYAAENAISLISLRAMEKASSLPTVNTSSMTPLSRTSGTNPAPIP
jgi:hypothetical protein